jgi:hypothetical protein
VLDGVKDSLVKGSKSTQKDEENTV